MTRTVEHAEVTTGDQTRIDALRGYAPNSPGGDLYTLSLIHI